MTTMEHTITRADLIEKLGHLVDDARRCNGTAYYGRRHQQINDTLDDLEWIDTGRLRSNPSTIAG